MSKSVLIVDDSESVRRVVRQFFEMLGDWKIAGEAADGVEAIDKATDLRPDVILLDFSMPRLNGIETASVLKKILPDALIVVFTMYDGNVSSRLSLAVGVGLVGAQDRRSKWLGEGCSSVTRYRRDDGSVAST